MPSIDELAKQQKLRTMIKDYQSQPDKKVFDDTMQFPTAFLIKIIGVNDSTFLSDTLNTIAKCTGKSPESISYSTKSTGGGQYLSISSSAMYSKASEIYAVYDAMSKDSRVKFML